MASLKYLLMETWLDLTSSESRARDEWITTKAYAAMMKRRYSLPPFTDKQATAAIKAAVESFTNDNNNDDNNTPSPAELTPAQRRNPNRPRAGNQSMTYMHKYIGGTRLTVVFVSRHYPPFLPFAKHEDGTAKRLFQLADDTIHLVDEEYDWTPIVSMNALIIEQPDRFIDSFSDRVKDRRLSRIDIKIASLTTVPSSSSAVPRPTYWDSSVARKLFRPQPEQSVTECLEERIQSLQQAVNFIDKIDTVVELEEDQTVKEDFNDFQKQRLLHKCRYLQRAYEIAVVRVGTGDSWYSCCHDTVEIMALEGLATLFLIHANMQ